MNYLYHAVPLTMKGTTLYPLTELEYREPELYTMYNAKYDHRPIVRDQVIHPLGNIPWNSVIFMTSTHPAAIKKALIDAGSPSRISRSYYQIDPHSLDQSKLTVFLFPTPEHFKPTAPEDFAPYYYEDLETYSNIPQATHDYFKLSISEGRRPLLYYGIPHILYHGSIDIANTPIITV